MKLVCELLESHSPTHKMRVGCRVHRSNVSVTFGTGIYETKPTSSHVFKWMIRA